MYLGEKKNLHILYSDKYPKYYINNIVNKMDKIKIENI